jgi:uncharacterized protein (DUF1499 family)
MGLLRWFTKNWANTTAPTHPDLAPLAVPVGLTDAFALVRKAIATLPRWAVAEQTPTALRLTRRTRLWGFTDDVAVTGAAAGDRTLIHAESRSRIGKGDLGQNRRNILELWNAVGSRPSAASPAGGG